jgi:DNA-binding Lrp family transcriptional regulator
VNIHVNLYISAGGEYSMARPEKEIDENLLLKLALDGLSYREIAHIMKISHVTVGNRLEKIAKTKVVKKKVLVS